MRLPIVIFLLISFIGVSCQKSAAVKAPCNGYGKFSAGIQSDCERISFPR